MCLSAPPCLPLSNFAWPGPAYADPPLLLNGPVLTGPVLDMPSLMLHYPALPQTRVGCRRRRRRLSGSARRGRHARVRRRSATSSSCSCSARGSSRTGTCAWSSSRQPGGAGRQGGAVAGRRRGRAGHGLLRHAGARPTDRGAAERPRVTDAAAASQAWHPSPCAFIPPARPLSLPLLPHLGQSWPAHIPLPLLALSPPLLHLLRFCVFRPAPSICSTSRFPLAHDV